MGDVFLPNGKLLSQNFKFLALNEGQVELDPVDAEELWDDELILFNFKHVLENVSPSSVSEHEDLVSRFKQRFLGLVFGVLPVIWAVEPECEKSHLVAQNRKVL